MKPHFRVGDKVYYAAKEGILTILACISRHDTPNTFLYAIEKYNGELYESYADRLVQYNIHGNICKNELITWDNESQFHLYEKGDPIFEVLGEIRKEIYGTI